MRCSNGEKGVCVISNDAISSVQITSSKNDSVADVGEKPRPVTLYVYLCS